MTLMYPDVLWEWPYIDAVDIAQYSARRWSKGGDSEIMALYAPGARTRTPPHYLVKIGRDALSERLSSLVAQAMDLPFQRTTWGLFEQHILAAIQFEVEARYPERIEMSEGQASAARYSARGRRHQPPIVSLRNPQDFHALRVLRQVAGDLDSMEVMALPDGTVFGIDGASGYEEVWMLLHGIEPSPQAITLQIGIEMAYEREPHAVVDATLRRFVEAPIAQLVEVSLQACPVEQVRQKAPRIAAFFATRQEQVHSLAEMVRPVR